MQAHAIYTPLRRRADFSRVHSQGRRKGDALVQVRVLRRPAPPTGTAPIRLGILVSKKYGSAVERNRFKRIVRAAVHALGPFFTPGWDILVLPRESHAAKMPEMLASLHQLLGALEVLADDGADPTEGDAAP